MEAGIPLGWKPLNLERYDGTTDPDEHLYAFLTQANLYTNDNTILCCVFTTSLKGATLTWYGGLPPRSIDSFNTLVSPHDLDHLIQFATSRRQVSQKVHGQIWVLFALRPDKFLDSLCKKSLGSMDELCE
ncbi:hypothetical protein JHK85_000845 [Glycine max]|nr:hypothetical protein JHK85_000845 [Glycine max]